ncbi:MAG: SDR family oxidoreductase [Spirochaetales bacterium]|nr:SDR family oxidoreductase [Spirochaetales bacterium]
MKEMRFNGKVVIITGAGQGLGAAYAVDFAAEGASVVLVGRTESKLEKVAAGIQSAGGTAMVCPADIAREDQVADLMEKVMVRFGTVDVLINNAAAHKSVALAETSKEDWDRQIDINLTGTFLCTRAVLPEMIKKRYGKIVNISSSAAKLFFPGFGAYSASKAGIVGLTHTLSEEVKQHNINVNALYLGMINTENTRARMGKDPAVTSQLEEMLQVEEVSKVVLFFASDDSSAIMGAAVDVFGKKA